MKTLVTVLTLAAVVAGPALTSPAFAASPEHEVIVGGKVIGADPDPNVRLQLRRDYGSEGY